MIVVTRSWIRRSNKPTVYKISTFSCYLFFKYLDVLLNSGFIKNCWRFLRYSINSRSPAYWSFLATESDRVSRDGFISERLIASIISFTILLHGRFILERSESLQILVIFIFVGVLLSLSGDNFIDRADWVIRLRSRDQVLIPRPPMIQCLFLFIHFIPKPGNVNLWRACKLR